MSFVICRWFEGCLRRADGVLDHPNGLEYVPTCRRCAGIVGRTLDPMPHTDHVQSDRWLLTERGAAALAKAQGFPLDDDLGIGALDAAVDELNATLDRHHLEGS